MGLRTVEIDSTSDTAVQIGSAQLTRGTLTSVVVSKLVNAPSIPKFAYATAALYRTNTDLENRVAILCEGYILTRYAIGWDGLIPIDEDMRIALHVLGFNADRYRLTCTLIDPQTGSSGVPRDP